MQFFFTFIAAAGFCIALGAATVIDLIGFLGRSSGYWTQTAIRAHKVTKPLIWVGITLAGIGLTGIYYPMWDRWFVAIHAGLFGVLIINGVYLHYTVSIQLLKRERFWLDTKLLPRSLQMKIVPSMLISFFGWWSALVLFIWVLLYV